MEDFSLRCLVCFNGKKTRCWYTSLAMVTIYTSSNCNSCKKAKKWFDEHHIPYQTKSIFSGDLTSEDLMEILQKSENGSDDIISKRSKIVMEQNINFDDMTISELIAFILKNPSILKRPLIVDDRRLQVGYNEEEIRTFIPRAQRFALLGCNRTDCEHYANCPSHNQED